MPTSSPFDEEARQELIEGGRTCRGGFVEIENVPESPCTEARRAHGQVMKGSDWQRGLTITFPPDRVATERESADLTYTLLTPCNPAHAPHLLCTVRRLLKTYF